MSNMRTMSRSELERLARDKQAEAIQRVDEALRALKEAKIALKRLGLAQQWEIAKRAKGAA